MSWYRAPERTYEDSQWLAAPIDRVFDFFSSEDNLEKITPPWLNFSVLKKSTPNIETGTLIDYRLKLYGIPFRWRTEIAVWEPGRKFVDQQLQGPYQKWHHTHTFREENGGTRMDDRVIYQLPFWVIGDAVAAWKVNRQVREIFAYRRQIIGDIFK